MDLHWAYSGEIVYYLTPGSLKVGQYVLKFAVCGLAFRVLSFSRCEYPIVPCQTSIEIIDE